MTAWQHPLHQDSPAHAPRPQVRGTPPVPAAARCTSTAVRDAQVQERGAPQSSQQAAGSQSSADQLADPADLRDRGVLTAEEFDREKAKILA